MEYRRIPLKPRSASWALKGFAFTRGDVLPCGAVVAVGCSLRARPSNVQGRGARVPPAFAAAGGSPSPRPPHAGSPHPCASRAVVRRSLVAHKSLGTFALRICRHWFAARCARRSRRGGRCLGSGALGICGLTARRSRPVRRAWSAALGARGTLPPTRRLALRALGPPCAPLWQSNVYLTSIEVASACGGGFRAPPSWRPRGWRDARGWGASRHPSVANISASRSSRVPSIS